MTAHPSNLALWLNNKDGDLALGEAAMAEPGKLQIQIRNRALGLNVFDWILSRLSGLIAPSLHYPAILGTDVAGEVVAVGSGVSRFKVGDRVLGLALGSDKNVNAASQGAFQQFTLLEEANAARLPDDLCFASAAVLPLSFATAASALLLDNQLGLDARGLFAESQPKDETVLIWGGSTSVGTCAIQLATACGYRVITTASPANFDYVRNLGAEAVFDYQDARAAAQITQALSTPLAGTLAIGTGSAGRCVEVLKRSSGVKRLAIASTPVPLNDLPDGGLLGWKSRTLPKLMTLMAAQTIRLKLNRIPASMIWGTDIAQQTIGKRLFGDFLEPALASGRFQIAAKPVVVGDKLAAIPKALRELRTTTPKGKLVVTL